MKAIVQSQIYQLKNDLLLKGAFLCMMIFTILPIPVYLLFSEEKISGGYFAVSLSAMNTYSVIFLILTAAYIVGRDFGDRTGYHDVLYGYKREEVLWGRFLVMLVVTVFMSMVLLLELPFVATLICGWGEEITVSEFLFRCMIYIFPVIRMCCEVTFLTVVCNELYQVYAIEFVLYILEMFFSDIKNPFVLVSSATSEIFKFESWTVSHIDGTVDVLYENTLRGDTIAMVILFSCTMSILYLLLAHFYFKSKDMN